jgi:hypothetical protein
MDDWQGCLSPLCQAALQAARTSVLERGGVAITVEDFLLALIDDNAPVAAFLRQQGIDLDELVRTIQCEQPIVSGLNGEDLLSSQLRCWLSLGRELSTNAWLDWAQLLQVLTHSAERLAGKAYIAVLEQIAHWPQSEHPGLPSHPAVPAPFRPVVMAESSFLKLAEDVAVFVTAEPKALVWLSGPPGSGKTTWLQSLAPALPDGLLAMDLRIGAELVGPAPGSGQGSAASGPAPLLVLDNTTPEDLLMLTADYRCLARRLLLFYDGPIIMLSQDNGCGGVRQLEQTLGRALKRFVMPAAGAAQNLAVLTAHQPDIEKRWSVEITNDTLSYTGSASAQAGMTPGGALAWLKRASARLALTAERGCARSQSLAGEADTLRRQLLVAYARQQPVADLEAALEQLSIERAAVEVEWHERRAAGTLRQVMAEDLAYERDRLEPSDETTDSQLQDSSLAQDRRQRMTP